MNSKQMDYSGHFQSASFPVGILGGGQLARMLLEAAYRLGLSPLVLADRASDPAAQLCPGAVLGGWKDPAVLRRFLSQVRVVVYENEFVPCEEIEIASRGLDVQFLPGLGALFQLQDKLRQKEIVTKLHIPTSPYLVFDRGGDLSRWLKSVKEKFERGFVLKWAQLGYDGKGTWISSDEVTASDLASARKFCETALIKKVPLYAEAKVRFRRELAVIGCYSTRGEFAAYPLVISQQQKGICKLVTGPATSLGVDKELESSAHRYAHQIAEALKLYGSFALELFETQDGQLWVNELAPRVHNSGHYTQNASATSQFENHWRAALGLPLGDTTSAPGFAMLNLLGPAGMDLGEGVAVPLPVVSSRGHLHWYGKTDLRAGRKMGHINGQVGSPEEVTGLVRELESSEQAWIDLLKGKENG